jgi:flagellar hook assembly protein FlgD
MLEEHSRVGLFPVARRIGVFPNPSASGFSILASVDGARAQKVSLDVFDVQGRRIRTDRFGTLDPGPVGVRWDGRADDGRPVRPGAYFLRLQIGSRALNQRLIVLP